MQVERFVLVASVAVIGVVAVSFVGPAIAQEDPSNETETSDPFLEDPDVELSELRDSGTNLPDAPAGVRTDQERIWYLEYWPANSLFADEGVRDSGQSDYVDASTTVQRQSVWLRTVKVEPGARTETINVAYWQTETHNNQTGLVALETETQEVEYQAGLPIMEIPLRSYDRDEPTQVTMWLESDPSVRWSFEYAPLATAEPIAISTVGDFWSQAIWWILIPVIGGIAVAKPAGEKAIERTGKGPGYPLWGWLMLIGVLLFVIVWWRFDELAELVAAAPYVIAALVVSITFLAIVESQAIRERQVEFIRPHVKGIDGPTGADATEILEADRAEETVVDMPDGDPAVVRKGVIPWLSRAFGQAARVPQVALKTRISTNTPEDDGGKSDVDEIVLVDPDAEDVLEYEPESFESDIPTDRSDQITLLAYAGLAVAISAAIGMRVGWLWGTSTALIGVAALLLSPTPGSAYVEAASVHVRAAWITSMTLSSNVSDARSLEEARGRLIEEQSRTEIEVQQALEQQDRTLVEEMFGSEVDRSMDGSDLPEEIASENPEDEEDDETDDAPDAGGVSA